MLTVLNNIDCLVIFTEEGLPLKVIKLNNLNEKMFSKPFNELLLLGLKAKIEDMLIEDVSNNHNLKIVQAISDRLGFMVEEAII